MSGHSKWANIRVRKGAQDAKRGKIYTKHAKLVEIAAREGGNGDPEENPRLKTAVENARADNVPNANIERAIKKGTGELKGAQTEAVTYEAYGPAGVACIIECFTDNKNRTLSSVRAKIEKSGGKFAVSGAVMFLFDHKGIVIGKKESGMSDDTELALIDAGAEDIERSDDLISVITDAKRWPHVRDVMKENGLTIEEAGLKYIAKQDLPVRDLETAKKIIAFIEGIEADDDVTEVHTNANFEESIAAKL